MPVQLLHDPGPSTCAAPPTFEAVLARIADARESIVIHMYVWRSDEIGHRVGRALLAAAERGVRVRILKDLGAILFERLEMNRKSFFDTPLPFLKRLNHRLIGLTFPDSFVEDEFTGALGERLLRHPGITLEWVHHTHTKYYLFDERVLVTGSINIGNDLNYRTIHEIFTKAPVAVHLTDSMIHSKLMLVDDETALLGSCNLSIFSLQKAGELDLLIRHPSPALATLREVIPRRIATATQVSSPTELRCYNPLLAILQQLHQKHE